MFYYLKTPILTVSHNASPGHRDKISSFDNYSEYSEWCDQNRWATEKRELVDHFLQSKDYENFKVRRRTDSRQWGKRILNIFNNFREALPKYLIILSLCVLIDIIVVNTLDIKETSITSLIGAEIGVFLGMIIKDIDKG